nr:hypothetical protein [Pandoravirus belohorizontensis]
MRPRCNNAAGACATSLALCTFFSLFILFFHLCLFRCVSFFLFFLARVAYLFCTCALCVGGGALVVARSRFFPIILLFPSRAQSPSPRPYLVQARQKAHMNASTSLFLFLFSLFFFLLSVTQTARGATKAQAGGPAYATVARCRPPNGPSNAAVAHQRPGDFGSIKRSRRLVSVLCSWLCLLCVVTQKNTQKEKKRVERKRAPLGFSLLACIALLLRFLFLVFPFIFFVVAPFCFVFAQRQREKGNFGQAPPFLPWRRVRARGLPPCGPTDGHASLFSPWPRALFFCTFS